MRGMAMTGVGAVAMALTLDAKMTDHPMIKNAKTLKKQANEYKNMAHKYKRSFGKSAVAAYIHQLQADRQLMCTRVNAGIG